MTTVILNTVTRKVEVFSSARDVQARTEIAAIKAKSPVTPADYGANGDGGNDTAAISDWLAAATDEGRIALIPEPKTYLVDEISLAITKDLHVESVKGAVIKGAGGFDTPVLTLNGGAARPSLIIDGLEIDNSLRTRVQNALSGSALRIVRLDYFDIRHFTARGGADLSTSPISGNGDNAITVEQCRWGVLYHPRAFHQPDFAFYVTGGPDDASEADDWGDITFINPLVIGCGQAIANKRQGRRLTVVGGMVVDCWAGISNLPVETVGSGRELVVLGTQFKRVTARCLWQRGQGKMLARGVLIEDFGYNTVTEDPDTFNWAIDISGSSYCSIDAHVRMRDWSGTGLEAIRLQQDTLVDSTVIQASNNRVTLQVEGVETAVRERHSSTANHYDLIFDGSVTTPINLATGSTSQWTHRDPSTGATTISRSGASVVNFDRQGSAGQIVEFHRDGVSKGTVSALAGNVIELSASSGELAFSADGSERARIDSSGRMLIGHSASIDAPLGTQAELQIHSTAAEIAITRWSNNSAQPFVMLNKSRSQSIGTRAAVADGDNLGDLSFAGDDGTAFIRGATVKAQVDGPPGPDDMPGRLLLQTTGAGNTVPTVRQRIDSGGGVEFPSVGTTASGSNAFLNSTSGNRLLRSTSSLAYKRDIEAIAPDRVQAVLELSGIWYRSRAAADNPDWSWYGFAAEDVATVDPRLVHYGYHEDDMEDVLVEVEEEVETGELDDTGRPLRATVRRADSIERRPKPGAEPKPDGVMYDRIAVMHHEVIRGLVKRIEALEAGRPLAGSESHDGT